jgi:hypothetical protein
MIKEGMRVILKPTAKVAPEFQADYTPGISVGTVTYSNGSVTLVSWDKTRNVVAVDTTDIEPIRTTPASTKPDCRWCRGTGVLALFSSVGPCDCR